MNALKNTQKKALIFMVLATVLLSAIPASCQTRPCNPVTKHACVGQDSVILCADVGGTLSPVPKPGTSVRRCTEGGFGLALPSAVCYTSASTLDTVCAAPPSTACTAAGNFAIVGRCQDFYSCIKSGPGAADFSQVVGSCSVGSRFSGGSCVLAATSQCVDTTPAPPTTTPAPTPCTPLLSRVADPSSCYQYLYCSQQGMKFTLKCPKNTFFNTAVNTCALTADCGTRPK